MLEIIRLIKLIKLIHCGAESQWNCTMSSEQNKSRAVTVEQETKAGGFNCWLGGPLLAHNSLHMWLNTRCQSFNFALDVTFFTCFIIVSIALLYNIYNKQNTFFLKRNLSIFDQERHTIKWPIFHFVKKRFKRCGGQEVENGFRIEFKKKIQFQVYLKTGWSVDVISFWRLKLLSRSATDHGGLISSSQY